MGGIKGQDIVVLLKLASLEQQWEGPHAGDARWGHQGEDPYSVRSLEKQLGISKTEVNASIQRSVASGLALRDRSDGRLRPNLRYLLDFIAHGLKFVFPAYPGAMTRGVPTAFAAPMLSELLVSAGQYIYVWPAAEARTTGQAVKPLFRSVPEAAERDVRLYEYLALVDAIRLGNPREAGLAKARLKDRLLG